MDTSALSAVRAAFDESIAEARLHVQRLGNAAFIPEPWLGDPISSTTQAHYNSVVMESADGPYSAMLAYVDELIRIRDSLQAVEDQYLSHEDRVAADMRRQQRA